MMRVFSNFSASCPALAENRKNGRMNNAGARFVYSAAARSLRPIWNATSINNALRNALSLKAPSAWVQKKGAKRRLPSSLNWLMRCPVVVVPRFRGGRGGAGLTPGACRTLLGRSANSSVRSIFPPILGPWNHHGPANRRKSVLAQLNSRLNQQSPTCSWQQEVVGKGPAERRKLWRSGAVRTPAVSHPRRGRAGA